MTHFQQNVFSKDSFSALSAVDRAFFYRLKDFIDEHLANIDLGANTVSNGMGISKSTLNRKLRKIADVTVNRCIRQRRLQCSIAFLKDGYKVKEVAPRVGFKTPSYFAQCFRALYRVPPSEYLNSGH